MAGAVVVTFEPGPHGVDACSRLGAHDGPAQERHAGCHTVRDTELRWDTLDLTVHRVLVTRASPDAGAAR